MPRQPAQPIQQVGQPSVSSIQLGAQRNNRIMEAMRQGTALAQQGMANRGDRIVTGMREKGAMERTKLGEEGANKRAGMAQQTAREQMGQTATLTREQMAQSDRQQAAELEAARERDAFQRETMRTMEQLRNENETAREMRNEARAKGDIERLEKWQGEEMKLRKVGLITQLSLMGSQMRMLMGVMNKQMGAESAQQAKINAIQRMDANYSAKAQGKAAITTQVSNMLAEYEPMQDLAVRDPDSFAAAGHAADSALATVSTKLQQPVTMDLFLSDARYDDLQEAAAEWGMDGHFKVMETLEGIKARLETEKERIAKGEKPTVTKRNTAMGFGGPVQGLPYKAKGSTDSAAQYLDGEIDRVQKALDRMESLKNSTRQSPNGRLLGPEVQAWEMNRLGATADAIAHQLKVNFGDDVGSMELALEEMYRDMFDPAMTAIPDHLRELIGDPEAVSAANTMLQSMMGKVPGVRRDVPTAQGPNPMNYMTTPSVGMAPQY